MPVNLQVYVLQRAAQLPFQRIFPPLNAAVPTWTYGFALLSLLLPLLFLLGSPLLQRPCYISGHDSRHRSATFDWVATWLANLAVSKVNLAPQKASMR